MLMAALLAVHIGQMDNPGDFGHEQRAQALRAIQIVNVTLPTVSGPLVGNALLWPSYGRYIENQLREAGLKVVDEFRPLEADFAMAELRMESVEDGGKAAIFTEITFRTYGAGGGTDETRTEMVICPKASEEDAAEQSVRYTAWVVAKDWIEANGLDDVTVSSRRAAESYPWVNAPTGGPNPPTYDDLFGPKRKARRPTARGRARRIPRRGSHAQGRAIALALALPAACGR